MKVKNLRILHFLNTARYDRAGKFLSTFDSNFKVMMKTIRFLPDCHHYIVVPDRGRFVDTKQIMKKEFNLERVDNISFLEYPYTHGSASNKATFDENGLHKMFENYVSQYEIIHEDKKFQRKLNNLVQTFDTQLNEKDFDDIKDLKESSRHFDGIAFKSMIKLHDFDIDFIFNHLPENHYNILSVLGSKKYGFLVNSFIFFHWVDTPKSRLNYQIYPTYYRQLEAIHLCDKAFFHTTASSEYLKLNFNPKDNPNIEMVFDDVQKKEAYMPLASDRFPESEPFDIPKFYNSKKEEKELIIFNHRWNTTTGVERMEKYMEGMEEEFEIWSTDVKVSPPKYVKSGRLSLGQYRYLLENSLCSVCFVDDYATWNLSLQDGLRLNKPVLIYKHSTFVAMLGEKYPLFFETKEEFQQLLKKIKKIKGKEFKYPVPDFEEQFKNNIIQNVKETFEAKKYKQESKNLKMWVNLIYQICKANPINCATKDAILFYGTKFLNKDSSGEFNDMHSESASWQFVRRQLIEFGIEDDCSQYQTTYRIPEHLEDKVKDFIKDLPKFEISFKELAKSKKINRSKNISNFFKEK